MCIRDSQTPAPPGQPTPTKVTDHSVSLTWPVSPSSDVTHYKVELRNVEDGPDAWKLAVDNVESNSYTISELNHEDEVVFRVLAYNENVPSESSPVSEKILIEGKAFEDFFVYRVNTIRPKATCCFGIFSIDLQYFD